MRNPPGGVITSAGRVEEQRDATGLHPFDPAIVSTTQLSYLAYTRI